MLALAQLPSCAGLSLPQVTRFFQQMVAAVTALLRQHHLDGAHFGPWGPIPGDVRAGPRGFVCFCASGRRVFARRPIRPRKVVWKNSWSSACAGPIDALDPRSAFRRPRSAFRVRQSLGRAPLLHGGVPRSLAATAHFPAAVVPGLAVWSAV